MVPQLVKKSKLFPGYVNVNNPGCNDQFCRVEHKCRHVIPQIVFYLNFYSW